MAHSSDGSTDVEDAAREERAGKEGVSVGAGEVVEARDLVG